jgi:hypothetical protein
MEARSMGLRTSFRPRSIPGPPEPAKMFRLCFGGCSSLLSQPNTLSVFRGSGRSHQSIGTCAVPCRREGAPKSDTPRSWGKSVVQPGPWLRFCRRFQNPSNGIWHRRRGVFCLWKTRDFEIFSFFKQRPQWPGDTLGPPDSLLSISFASTKYSAANFRSRTCVSLSPILLACHSHLAACSRK